MAALHEAVLVHPSSPTIQMCPGTILMKKKKRKGKRQELHEKIIW